MRDGIRRSLGLALLVGVLCAPPVWAQDRSDQDRSAENHPAKDQASPGARPWSDPPAKSGEAPATPAVGKAATVEPEVSPPVAKPARIAAKPAGTARRQRSAERPAAARRRAEARERAAPRPIRRSVAEAPPPRAAAFRPAEPSRMRFARPLPPEMHGDRDVDLWVDARADRIRRARDGGFLVMRRTTLEDALGRRMHVLRPLDDEDDEDLPARPAFAPAR